MEEIENLEPIEDETLETDSEIIETPTAETEGSENSESENEEEKNTEEPEQQENEIETVKERITVLEEKTEQISESVSAIYEAVNSNTETVESFSSTISGLTDSFNSTSESLSEEIKNRQNGIENLRTELSDLISEKISKETESRNQIEAVIQKQLELEEQERKDSYTELESKLYQDITETLSNVDYATADKAVKKELTSHIETVQTELTTEVKELETLLTDFNTKLNEEIASRIKADNALQSNLNSSGGSSDYSSNYELMTIEQTDEGVVLDNSIFLQSLDSIDSHVTALQIKEYIAAASQVDFEKEVKDRKEEDVKLSSKLTTESTSRQEEDERLQTEIDSLDSRTTKAESVIKTLTGSGEGSIKKSIADKIAEVIADAPEAFDTLKEIADWVNSHEDTALTMQNAISKNAETIETEIEDRKTDSENLNEKIETETSERIKNDEALKENIIDLTKALETEAAERENTKHFIHDQLKEEFENQISDLTLNTVGEVIDEKHLELSVEVGKNTQNISILEEKIQDNKEEIEKLNGTVYSEKTANRILISTNTGNPKWDSIGSLVKSLNVNTSSIDERGNAYINIPYGSKLVTFSNASNSIDGFIVPFRSTNGNWYLHVGNWWGGVTTNGTVRGTVYYVD